MSITPDIARQPLCLPPHVEIVEIVGRPDGSELPREDECRPLSLKIIPPERLLAIGEAIDWVDKHSMRLPSCSFRGSFIYTGDPVIDESPRFVSYVIRRRS